MQVSLDPFAFFRTIFKKIDAPIRRTPDDADHRTFCALTEQEGSVFMLKFVAFLKD